jgi:hypothetical protein
MPRRHLMNMAFRRLVGVILLTSVAASPLAAQSTTGSIQGTVKDNQDALVPGATVTVRNIDTGLTRTLMTEGSGVYR